MRVCGLCPPDEDSSENRVSPIELKLDSCLPQPLYAIFLADLEAHILRKEGGADAAISQKHGCAMRDLQWWRAKVRTDACFMTSCEQKRSGCVAPSCFSFFLSGLLFAFMMTFPLTLLCVRR